MASRRYDGGRDGRRRLGVLDHRRFVGSGDRLQQHVDPQGKLRTEPEGVDEVIGPRRQSVGVNKHAQALAMQRQPRHEIGEDVDVECDLVRRCRVRADGHLVSAMELHLEPLRDACPNAPAIDRVEAGSK